MSVRSDPDGDKRDRPSNVLLTGTGDDGESAACRELSEQHAPSRSHVVLATGLGSAGERLADWDAEVGVRPAETTVVDMATATRSAAATTSASETDRWPGATVEHVDAGDLLGLGETLDGALAGSDRPTTLCVHSVSDLLQSADRRTVFGFLEALTRNVERAGGVAHYHLNADLHDAETVDERFDGHVRKPASRSTLRATVDRLCQCVAYRDALDRYFDLARRVGALSEDDPESDRLHEYLAELEAELDEAATPLDSGDIYEAAIRGQ